MGLDTLKAASQVAVNIEENFDMSSSASVDCMTFSHSTTSLLVWSPELFLHPNPVSKFEDNLSSNLPQSSVLM
jgi:hypothetical protein